MKVGRKYLCQNGWIAHIECKYRCGGFGGTMKDKEGNIVYNKNFHGWAASYNKNGHHPNKNLQTVRRIKE